MTTDTTATSNTSAPPVRADADLPLRRRLARSGLVLGPLLLAAGGVVTPEAGESGRSLVAAVGAGPARWTAGQLTTIAGGALLLVGLAHLASRLPARARTAAVGLTWFAVGVLGQALLAATELLLVPLSAPGDEAAAAAVDRISESNGLAVIFVLYLPGMLLGGLLLFLGLRVCRMISSGVAALGAAAVCFGFFVEDAVPAGDLVTGAALATALLVATVSRRPRRASPAEL